MQQNGEQVIGTSYCKNHPEIQSRYFVTDQPWVKYCSQCALNVALCGRNISQDFNSQQFDRKMQIVSLVAELRANTRQVDQNGAFYQKIIELLEQSAKPLTERIGDIDQSIRQLTDVRDRLQKLYNLQIAGKISEYVERQSKMLVNTRQIRAELELIESNFTLLVSTSQQNEFQDRLKRWGQLAQKSRKDLISEDDFNKGKEKILEVMEVFYGQIEKLSTFTINIDPRQFRGVPEETVFDMVLTPIDANSLSMSLTMEGNAFKKNKRELKLRSGNKRTHTERELPSGKKSKGRASFCGIENRELASLYRDSK